MTKNLLLSFIFIIVFYLLSYVLMLLNIIDDGIFSLNRVFIGFYQWIYLIPIYFILKKKGRYVKGLLIGGVSITLLNIGLIVWILIDPSNFI
ncbi:hypothetical protein [Litchfieldia alkalitelluris]|uniref:hypothetical protein n=1 Tax=Litchfieldia alkalitelluris TaxID=304268 RepID=UPI000995FDF2|nr:hypothetical protein [Litchfieldia alkalitelluris]